MNPELTKNESASAGGKLKSIPQILHQGIISPTSLTSSSFGTMEFIRKKRKIKFNADSRLSLGVSLLLEALTFLSVVLYRWVHIHFYKKSESYFLYLWLENLTVLGICQLLFKMFNLPKYTFSKNFKFLYPIYILNGISIVIQGYDFVQFTRKSGGTEFYQFSLVLFIPALMAIMNVISTFKLPWHVSSIIGICTILKMAFLLQDHDFLVSFTVCMGSTMYALTFMSFLVCLKGDLQKYTALELIYSLATMALLIFPFFIIQRGELSNGIGFKLLMASVLSGCLKLCSVYFTFVLLKHTDPMKTLVILNAAFIPDHFIQALLYKMDCHISTSKVCFFLVVDFVMGHFKRTVAEVGLEERDERIRYSLMR